MARFASPEWTAELDAALRAVTASGPPLRVRYRFPADDPAGTEAGYDLVFGTGVRAEPGRTGESGVVPTVTVVQPWSTAREVAAGRLAAQQALLDGSITVSGAVTALLDWGGVLGTVDAAVSALRARTTW